jgi:predicted amidohydrolase YtcJ
MQVSAAHVKRCCMPTRGNAARALGEQDRIGSIAPGKQADFALLDRDVLTVTAEEARDTKVLWTIVGGKTVYGSKP